MNPTQVKQTPPIKLKDKAGRGGVSFDLLKDFGFIPDSIIVQKVQGKNNTIVVSAPYTEAELEKRKAESDKAHETISEVRARMKAKEAKK